MKAVAAHRKLVNEQLYSGHMRIDLGRPMAKGNFIVFKGHRNQGKSTVALSAIQRFVCENPSHKAVYVGFAKNLGDQLIRNLNEQHKS